MQVDLSTKVPAGKEVNMLEREQKASMHIGMNMIRMCPKFEEINQLISRLQGSEHTLNLQQ